MLIIFIGSLAGGTLVNITGDGFNPRTTSVYVGRKTAHPIKNAIVTSNSIVFTTEDSTSSESTFDILVKSNGVDAVCADECRFSFSLEKTPLITSVTPNIFNRLNTTLTIRGRHFGNESRQVFAYIGSQSCRIEFLNDSVVVCVLDNLSLGDHAVNLRVNGKNKEFILSFSDIYVLPCIFTP